MLAAERAYTPGETRLRRVLLQKPTRRSLGIIRALRQCHRQVVTNRRIVAVLRHRIPTRTAALRLSAVTQRYTL
jgi:hypothetical protein